MSTVQPIKRSAEDLSFGSDDPHEESAVKKVKMTAGSTTTPSKVLHARGLPDDCLEHELTTIASPFGVVTNVLLMKGKGQAFIEMNDVTSATALVQYYTTVQASVRSKNIYFQYSNRQEISSHGNPQQETQNHIILVTVLNMIYPIGIDILHRIFAKYGSILKIVIFTKSAGFQSLIQFNDVVSAVNARSELDGQNIYSNCCTLRIQYSTLTNLNVKYNNEKSRDYTNPNLPPGPSEGSHAGYDGANAGGGQWPGGAPGGAGGQWPGGAVPPGYPGPPIYNYPHNMAIPGGVKSPFSPNAGFSTSSNSPVLIVSGLSSERATPDSLFVLFGVYGDVLRVKILYTKQDTALIQFSNGQQSETALRHLNGCPMYGGVLKINFSKHHFISLPKPGSGQEDMELTKDYTNSPLHRYKVIGSRNYQHICQPSSVLHLSNIPETVSEEMVTELFGQYGTIVGFKFFATSRKMAVVQMGDVEEAVAALIGCHNYRLDDQNVRVSFSKTGL